MELALSLGDTPKPYTFNEKSQEKMKMVNKENLGFCMAIGKEGTNNENTTSKESSRGSSDPPPLQLHLLPFSPLPTNQTPSHSHHLSFSWLTHNLVEPGSSNGGGGSGKRLQEVNRLSIGGAMEKAGEDGSGTALSSPNSTTSSFQMEFSMYKSGRSNKRGASEFEGDNTDRASDEEDNGLARKKLRLTKQQSAFLEQNFKEHNTLNPKQKLALAKQLNLRPRQVEVWFQNRRARTKLKQTEVDCEYLKRCCETLTEENRKLQKEVQELRAFKSSKPFYMQLPPTTLTMCPSCERVASTTTNASAPPPGGTTTTTDTTLSLAKPEPVSPPPAQVHAPTRLPRD